MKNEKQIATKKIEEITAKFNADMAELKAIIDKPDVVWPPRLDQKVWIIDKQESEIFESKWMASKIQITLLKQCRAHPTREQAEFYRDFLELESKRTNVRFRLHEFAKRVNEGWVANWNNKDQVKHYIGLDKNKFSLNASYRTKHNDLPVFKIDCIKELYNEFTPEEIAMLFEVVE